MENNEKEDIVVMLPSRLFDGTLSLNAVGLYVEILSLQNKFDEVIPFEDFKTALNSTSKEAKVNSDVTRALIEMALEELIENGFLQKSENGESFVICD